MTSSFELTDWQIYWPAWWHIKPHYNEIYDGDFGITDWWFCWSIFQFRGYKG